MMSDVVRIQVSDRLKHNEELAKKSSRHRTPHVRALVEAMGSDEALRNATYRWDELRPDVMTAAELCAFLEHELPGLSCPEVKAATGELEEICKGADGNLLMFDVGMVLRAVALYEVMDYRPLPPATAAPVPATAAARGPATAHTSNTNIQNPRRELTYGGPAADRPRFERRVTMLFEERTATAAEAVAAVDAALRATTRCVSLPPQEGDAHYDSEMQAPVQLVRVTTLANEIEDGEEEMRRAQPNVRAVPSPHMRSLFTLASASRIVHTWAPRASLSPIGEEHAPILSGQGRAFGCSN